MGVNLSICIHQTLPPHPSMMKNSKHYSETFHKIYKSTVMVHYLAEVTPLTIPSWGTDCNGTKCQLCRIHTCRVSASVFVSWIVEQVPCSGALTIAHSQCLFIPVSGMEREVDMEGEWERKKGDVRRTKRPKAPKRPIPLLLESESQSPLRKRGVRCMECPACLRADDCGKCSNCR